MKEWLDAAWYVGWSVVVAHIAIAEFRAGDDWSAAVFVTAVLIGTNRAYAAIERARGVTS